MQKFILNYANQSPLQINRLNACLVLLALSLLATLAFFTLNLEDKYRTQKASLDANKPTQTTHRMSPEFQETLGYAKETKDKLNFQWLNLLTELERVRANNQSIYFLSIEPNKAKADMMISGEAKQFNDIVQLISALKASPIFTDAVLVNHYLVVDPLDKLSQDAVYHFNLRVNWK